MGQLRNVQSITREGAQALAEAGEGEARRRGWSVAIAKARTAARFKRPTKVLEDAIAGGRHALLGVGWALPLEGGVPIMVDGAIVGAVGVSGMTSAEDGGVVSAAALRVIRR